MPTWYSQYKQQYQSCPYLKALQLYLNTQADYKCILELDISADFPASQDIRLQGSLNFKASARDVKTMPQ